MIDARIPLGIQPVQLPDRVGGLAQIMQLIGAQQQVRLGDLQFSKLQKDMADEEATKTAYAAYLKDPTSVSLAELGQKNPKLVQDILKQKREAEKTQAEIDKANAEAELKKFEMGAKKAERAANILSGVKDQASYELALASLVQNFGMSAIEGLPERYDPKVLASKIQEGMSLKDWSTQRFNELKFAWEKDAKKIDQDTARYTAESGRISAGASVMSARAATTSAGAAVTNARTNAERERREATAPRGQYDAERGLIVDPRTGVARPVTDPSGAPLAGKLSSTQQDDLTSIERTLAATKRLKTSFKPEYVGMAGAAGEFNDKWTSQAAAPLGLDRFVTDPDRVKFRADAADLENQYIKTISGATVPESEVPRLRRAIPTASDSPAQFKAKLELMEKNLAELPNIIRRSSQRTATGASAAAPPNPADFGLRPAGR